MSMDSSPMSQTFPKLYQGLQEAPNCQPALFQMLSILVVALSSGAGEQASVTDASHKVDGINKEP